VGENAVSVTALERGTVGGDGRLDGSMDRTSRHISSEHLGLAPVFRESRDVPLKIVGDEPQAENAKCDKHPVVHTDTVGFARTLETMPIPPKKDGWAGPTRLSSIHGFGCAARTAAKNPRHCAARFAAQQPRARPRSAYNSQTW
jgi:hypothetical protein